MAIEGLLVILPALCGLACLFGPRVSRVARWIPLALGAAALIEGAILLTAERSFYRGIVQIPLAKGNAPLVLVLWDWASVVGVGASLCAAAFAFAGSPPTPRQDAWLLLNVSLVALGVGAGSPALTYLVLAGAAGSYVLAMLGARGLTLGHVAFGLAGVAASVLGSLGWSHAMALTSSGSGFEFLFDLCLFPQPRLDESAVLVRSLLGGLVLLAGAWPFCLASGPGWRAITPRLSAAALVAGPQGLALAVWLRVLLHGSEQVGAGLALGAVSYDLLMLTGLAVLWHLARLGGAYLPLWRLARLTRAATLTYPFGLPEPQAAAGAFLAQVGALSQVRLTVRRVSEEATLGALAGLQVSYAILALLLASLGVARGYYALVACLATLVLSASGGLLGMRLTGSELSPTVRVASWASLVGMPPFVGFFARFLLVQAAVQGLGSLGYLLLASWLIELAAVIRYVWLATVSRGSLTEPPFGTPVSAEGSGRTGSTAWLAASVLLQLAAGPASLFLGDALARQMLPTGR